MSARNQETPFVFVTVSFILRMVAQAGGALIIKSLEGDHRPIGTSTIGTRRPGGPFRKPGRFTKPELMDMSGEPKPVLEMYGAKPGDGSYASAVGERFVRQTHMRSRPPRSFLTTFPKGGVVFGNSLWESQALSGQSPR